MTEDLYCLRWAWRKDDQFMVRADVSVSETFTNLGYDCIPGTRYLSMHGYSPTPKRDMMTAFVGPEGAVLLCLRCRAEKGGLHFHITSQTNPNSPTSRIYADVQKVNSIARRGTLITSRLDEAEGMLRSGWYRALTIVGIGGSVAGLVTLPVIQQSFMYPFLKFTCALVLLVSLLHLILTLSLPLGKVLAFLRSKR